MIPMRPFDAAWHLVKSKSGLGYGGKDDDERRKVGRINVEDIPIPDDTGAALIAQKNKERQERMRGMAEGTHSRPYAEFNSEELQSLSRGQLPLDPFQLNAAREENQLRQLSSLGQVAAPRNITGDQFQFGFNTEFQDKLASEPFDAAWALLR